MSALDYHLQELEVAMQEDDGRRLLPDLPARFERILDVGCGVGQTLAACNLKPGTVAYGIDLDEEALAYGQALMPHIRFIRASGENLPFPDQAFDVVISRVALPYMNLPAAFGEISRVLKPGGQVWFTLHPPSLVIRDLARAVARLNLKTVSYLSYVIVNSLWFHLRGDLFRHPLRSSRIESFQTERGVSRAMRAAGFNYIRVRKESLFWADPSGAQKQAFFVVTARKLRSGAQPDRLPARMETRASLAKRPLPPGAC
jgi:SAM-dependent methyltransferase